MSMATMRFRTIVFSASALVLTPLGADEITSHRDSGKPYFLSVDNTLRDDGLLDAKEHLKNSRSLITYIPPAPMRRTPLIRTGKLGTRSPNNGPARS